MKPKPNPNTQARVDAADPAGLAKFKADAAELTLARWHAMLRSAGVLDTRFEVRSDGILIHLRGARGRRTVECEKLVPKGRPFPLYAMLALHEFDTTLSTAAVPPPDVEPTALEALADIGTLEALADYLVPADVAADIARQARAVDTTKPAPAGQGQRRPLSLPLCKVCKAQPVYTPVSDFCGAECARKWHTEHADATAKGIPIMITPDVARLAKRARAKGTVLAVVEFLCRTRAEFSIADVAREAPKLGVPVPADFQKVRHTMLAAVSAGLCRAGTGVVWRSKVTGRMP